MPPIDFRNQNIIKKSKNRHHLANVCSWTFFVSAERGGFEPPNRFRRLHAFQACLFNHSSTFPWLTPLCHFRAAAICVCKGMIFFPLKPSVETKTLHRYTKKDLYSPPGAMVSSHFAKSHLTLLFLAVQMALLVPVTNVSAQKSASSSMTGQWSEPITSFKMRASRT